MPEIKITEGEQRAAFDAVYNIISSGLLTSIGGISLNTDSGVINHGNMSYVFLDGGLDESAETKGESFTIEEDGASWFKGFRGNADPDIAALGAWEVFLGNFSSEFHKKFFLTAYPMRRCEADGAFGEKLGDNVCRFLSAIYPHITDMTVARTSGNVGEEDVYALTLRMQIGTTMGEKVPMVGKLFMSRSSDIRLFRERDLKPIPSEDAELMFRDFETYSDKRTVADLGLIAATDIKSTATVLGEISKKLSSMIAANEEYPISDYVFFDPESEKKLDSMLEKLAVGERVLECGQIEVLGVSNIRWQTTTLDIVSSTGAKLFRVSGGTDNKVTVRCLGCGGADIVSNNVITAKLEGGDVLRLPIDLSQRDFGISEKDLELIRSSETVAAHYVKRSNAVCKWGSRKKKCPSYICRAHLVTLPEGETVCRACKYPEIVYKGSDGLDHYTPKSTFVSDLSEFRPSPEAVKCQGGCGRYIGRGDNTLCPLCREVKNLMKGREEAEKRYGRYRSLIPIEARLLGAGYTKLCYEDRELLIFVFAKELPSGGLVPKKKFLFHKLWADGNTVKAPVRMEV